MSVPESISKKLPIVNTSIQILGVLCAICIGCYNYLYKAESNYEASNKNYENLVKVVEVVAKRVDNHDIVLGSHEKRMSDTELKVAVINANLENMGKTMTRVEDGQEMSLILQREMLEKIKKYR